MPYYYLFDVDIDEIQSLYFAGLLGKAPVNLVEAEYDRANPSEMLRQYTWTEGLITATYLSNGATSEYRYTLVD